MSPSNFNSWNANANMFRVNPSGEFVNNWVAGSNGVRKILVKSLKLIKIYLKVTKNKTNPWVFPKKEI